MVILFFLFVKMFTFLGSLIYNILSKEGKELKND